MAFPDVSALTEIMFLSCYCINKEDGCVWEGQLHELEDHHKGCEFSANMECPWVGGTHCHFTGSKREIEKHLKEETVQHNALFAVFLSEVMNSFNEVRNSMNEVKGQTKDLQSKIEAEGHALIATKDTLAEVFNFFKTNTIQIDTIKKWYVEFDQRVTLLEVNTEFSGLKDFHNEVKVLIDKVEKQQSFVRDAVDGGKKTDEGSLVQSKKNLEDKLARLNKAHKQHNTQLQDTDLKIRLYQSTTFNGKYVWKLDNFRSRLTEALSGKITELYTPPLYTSPFGYKFSAKVLLYGDPKDKEEGSAPHLSFYIVLMQGDFDEILKFPFPFTANITLINLAKKSDITHRLIPDNRPHFGKPVRDMNPAIGFSKFCSHDSLYGNGFVRDDAIFFRIEMEKMEDTGYI